MLLVAFSGLTIATGLAGDQNKLYAALPPWFDIAFGSALLLGAALNFTAVYWPGRPVTGVGLEAASVLWLAAVGAAFAGVVSHDPAARAVPGSASAIVTCLVFAGFSLARYRQCRKAAREIAAFRAAVKGGRDV